MGGAKERRARIGLLGAEPVAWTSGIRQKAESNLHYIEEELGDIARI